MGKQDARVDAAVGAGTVLIAGVATPIGTFRAVLTPLGLARLAFPSEPPDECDLGTDRHPGVGVLHQLLDEL